MKSWMSMTREGGNVIRNHTSITLLHQTIAQHSFNMCCIVLEMSGGEASRELLKACLYHDLSEQHIGDTPSPAKWDSPDLHAALHELQEVFDAEWGLNCDLSIEEKEILHFADTLEFLQYCVEERKLGNIGIKKIYNRCLKVMKRYDILEINPQARDLLKEVRDEAMMLGMEP